MTEIKVGEGNVVLIAGGGRIYTDLAARFVRSEKDLEEIIATPYDRKIVKNILSSNHLAATEFDYFIFGVEGHSRVTETELVRKRIASYLIKSGTINMKGKRKFEVAIPESIKPVKITVPLDASNVFTDKACEHPVSELRPRFGIKTLYMPIDYHDILSYIEAWYDKGVQMEIPENDLRFMKPQATTFKAIIGMNAHALIDWFGIRTCNNAQYEIRTMAKKMLALCKEAAPDLFEGAGPNCVRFGYCPENARQCQQMKGHVYTKDEALAILKKARGITAPYDASLSASASVLNSAT